VKGFWFWLDLLIFGNGHGLAQPFHDGRFYWLSGQLYTFHGWYGAQLTSFQWLHPKPGERRTLAGYEFRPFMSHRQGLRVRVSWKATALPPTLGEAGRFLRELQHKLNNHL
jgi:hypothetical protein